MSSSTTGSSHNERPRVDFNRGRPSTLNTSRRWYHHPFVVFFVPLVTLLCFPSVYDFLSSYGSTSQLYNEHQLREVASLLDDIYTMFANMTFIPHTSIKRGPHRINMTAISCKRDPAVLRLMEILPYVDNFRVHEPDWLFGGHFMDYRRPDHLMEACDPLHARDYWDYMTPHTLALTNWGTGGWNNDRTWVLMYDTRKHSMRVYEGEEWVVQHPYGGLHGHEFNGVDIFSQGIEAREPLWDSNDNQLTQWFDAVVLLKRLKQAYHSAAWSPWETSNSENGWGVDRSIITHLLLKNGWSKTFSPDQFNVDFIRAKHKPSPRGFAEDAFKRIEELQGMLRTDGSTKDPGYIQHTKHRLEQLEVQLAKASNEDERWTFKWRVQKAKWDLEQEEADLEEAKQLVRQLCPNEVCFDDEDFILWEFRALERELEKAEHSANATSKCRKQLDYISQWAPPDPDQTADCIAQFELEEQWLSLAYFQAKTVALEHCTRTNKTLLPPDTLEGRARAKIAQLKQDIARDKERIQKMIDWEHNLPEHATTAIQEFRQWDSAVANGPWYVRDTIKWIEEQLANGGDKERLWRCLDDQDCI
ncbi:hypothetical protein BKA66DRAFT_606252 [Pyrenochaeta sp. MPI-SDFR-AT-0127]|nr:hypothetical protein BKA66DRAFT_606252 [Pyrenochaeta sp. MPI-SDFR-AT-0127]